MAALPPKFDLSPVKYIIVFRPGGMVTCTCPNFITRGCICKHIRAAAVHTELLHMQGLPLPYLRSWVPNTEDKAYLLQSCICARALPIQMSVPMTTTLDPIAQASIAINNLLRESTESENPQSDSEFEQLDELTANGASDIADSEFCTDSPDNAAIDNDNDNTEELQQPNKQVLNEQTIAGTLHDLEKVTPRLNQMAEWLDGAHLTKDAITDVTRAQNVQSSLKKLTHNSTGWCLKWTLRLRPSHQQQIHPVLPHLQLPLCANFTKPSQPIIGPLWELRAQKRKESYGVH
ncbi:hypothetical protein BC835DRAFT_1310930 [Cytidiella melzeri]|nr:hypothetical protein BC835DRAFT_1310930 [Cytidiella melzeri]